MRRTTLRYLGAGLVGVLLFVVIQAGGRQSDAAGPEAAAALPKVPLGLPPLPPTPDNPMTAEKVELGKLLYFDKRVSKDGTVSCATCHDPKMAWAEHTPTSEGIGHQKGGRNSPTVINAAYATSQFWDGRAKTLEEQATGPVENPIEMGHTMEAVVEPSPRSPSTRSGSRRSSAPGSPRRASPRRSPPSSGPCSAAIRPTIVSCKGDQNALTDAQKRGWELFRSNCSTCHTPPLFSNYRFFNAGVGMDKPNPDEGRKKVTGKDSDLGKFRVPALRDVANTAPYFHDGSAAKLEDAVALMAGGGKDNPNLSEMLKSVREAKLSAQGPEGPRRVPQGPLRQVPGHRAAGAAEVIAARGGSSTGCCSASGLTV